MVSCTALVFAVFLGAYAAPRRAAKSDLAAVQTLAISRPTGAACHGGRGTVVVVGQDGEVGEFDPGGRCRQLVSPEGVGSPMDLQGVTVDPLTGWLYVVDRAAYRIHEIDLDASPARVRRSFEVRPDDVPPWRPFRKSARGGSRGGLTGICFLPPEGRERGGRFILAHDGEPAGLLEVELPVGEPVLSETQPQAAQFVNWYDIGTEGLSEVAYDSATRSLLVLSESRRELLWVSLDGRLLGHLGLPRPGMRGLALLPDRRLFVALVEGGVQWLGPDQWGDTLPSSSRIASSPPPREAVPPAPYHTMVDGLLKDELFPHLYTRQGIWRFQPNGWILFGFGGQFLFMMRFVVQWFVSERQKRVVVPVVFWYISIAGSLAILIYALRDFRGKDIVFVAGQALACAIYIRNLMLIYRRRRTGDAGEADDRVLGRAVS